MKYTNVLQVHDQAEVHANDVTEAALTGRIHLKLVFYTHLQQVSL